jgi:dihydroorotase
MVNTQIKITRPSNMHGHIRQMTGPDPLMPILAPLFAETYHYFTAMPNTSPPIKTGVDCIRYQQDIMHCLPESARDAFHPITPIKMLWDKNFKTTPQVIEEAHAYGIRWAKMYMRGVTTNSDDGIQLENLPELYPTFRKMAELGWILQIHGEHPGPRILAIHREFKFHPYFLRIHEESPDLKIIFEHISDRRTIELVKQMPENIAGTLSTHFMYMTLNDVVEPGLRPKNSCKPIAKEFEDCEAIVEAAISGHKKWLFGSDIAGHIIKNKYKDSGACGCFPGEYDLLWVLKKFDEMKSLDKFEQFVSLNGPRFYGLPIPEQKMTFVRTVEYKTDTMFHDIEIWKGGETLNWKIAS